MNNQRSGFTVREATTRDVPTLSRFRAELFLELDGAVGSDFEYTCRRAFESSLASSTCVAWLAETLESEPVGTLALLRFPKLPTPKNPLTTEGYILNVFVVPGWRRRGVASTLLRSAIDYGRRSGLGRIRLHATASGQTVYEGMGFVGRDNSMELDLTTNS